MELKSSPRLFIGIFLLLSGVVLTLGFWWLYLLIQLGERLDDLVQGEEVTTKLLTLAKWEGGTFLILITILSGTLLFLYFRDEKKNRAFQAFFSSVTHELKTPLASMQLQAEVLKELAEETGEKKVQNLTSRLIQDTHNLETQMDKVLQLSRLERGGTLNIVSVDVKSKINKFVDRFSDVISFEISIEDDYQILADEFALDVILKNLIENTLRHDQNNKAKISVNKKDENILLTYHDEGSFDGDSAKLAQLFYKHNSSKGSGIGLYLIKGLMSSLKGSASFKTNQGFKTILSFRPSEGSAS